MRKLKVFSFLIAMIGIFVFTVNETQANAAELVDKQEPELTFDITKNEFQETTFVDGEGNEVTLSIEPVIKQNTKKSSDFSTLATSSQYYFPYGTSTYKVKGTNGMLTATYYIDVNVPSTNIYNSKITKAYDSNYFCVGCTISDPKLVYTSSSATFTCTTSFLGYTSNSNRLRVILSGNVLSIYKEF